MAVSVVALIACHNRRELTLTCLRSLFRVSLPDLDLSVVLVDDGSTDGTREAVEGLGLPVTVVRGPGDWYWSRSMAEAERIAELRDPDWLLWLNDDVEVSPQGLLELVAVGRVHPDAILVGPLASRNKGERIVYTGFSWPDPRDILRLRAVVRTGEIHEVEGFHGNFVGVPRSARRRIGPIDGGWPHNFADLDYAKRAAAAGVRMLTLPRAAGWCEPAEKNYLDRTSTPWRRLRSALARDGWPVGAHVRFVRRHRTGLVLPSLWRTYRRVWDGRRTAHDQVEAL